MQILGQWISSPLLCTHMNSNVPQFKMLSHIFLKSKQYLKQFERYILDIIKAIKVIRENKKKKKAENLTDYA